jgi:hypothetical protein
MGDHMKHNERGELTEPDATVVGTPQPGRRVRVTLEGTCTRSEAVGRWGLRLSNGGVLDLHDSIVPEVLPDPEPAWWPPQAGDVVAAAGFPVPLVRGRDGTWYDIDGGTASDDGMHAAITRGTAHRLLVRGGKPYQDPRQQEALIDAMTRDVSRETLDWPR